MSTKNGDTATSRASHCYVPHRGPDIPLERFEQDDLFKQMAKALQHGIRPCNMLASEMENIYRMRATILQQRIDIEAGDTAISQLEQGHAALRDQLEMAQNELRAWHRLRAAGGVSSD